MPIYMPKSHDRNVHTEKCAYKILLHLVTARTITICSCMPISHSHKPGYGL